jgi:hypothetical protein
MKINRFSIFIIERIPLPKHAKKLIQERCIWNSYKEWSKDKVNRRYCLNKQKEISFDKILRRYNRNGKFKCLEFRTPQSFFPVFRRPGIYTQERDSVTILQSEFADSVMNREFYFHFQDNYVV